MSEIYMTEKSKEVLDNIFQKREREKQIKEKILSESNKVDEVEEIEKKNNIKPFFNTDYLLRKTFYKQPKDLDQYVEAGIISMQSVYIYNILYNKFRYERALQIKYKSDLKEYIDLNKNELMKKCNIKWNKTLDKYLDELERAFLIKIEKNNTLKTRFYLLLF